ncbi:MAG: DegT/DnrJ/EryC1/StrS aminotransferase family protein [Bacteroidales bacterium]|nr:DegT/DnrJ/EryC1/StrS aminotransferase family protein [Bacteroidales bacterium]
MIPFSPPRIDDKIIAEVTAALNSGWITTGPRVKKFEELLARFCEVSNVLCVNSNSAGMELMLHWFGVGPGDEVIVPAYTYCATANVVMHCGATPVMVDVNDDFDINVEAVRRAITPRTKVIMPVDIAGFPCDYDALNALVRDPEVMKLFTPVTEAQRSLGRSLLLEDAAHSLGARYHGKALGSNADIVVFSFHAVKNLTTAEGGAIALNLPVPFNNEQVYKYLRIKSLHGQSKDALAKTQIGNWRYDVTEPGYKCNMTDVLAAIGIVELERYDDETLVRRKQIFDAYSAAFAKDSHFQVPVYESGDRVSSYHVYPLRINGITEQQRDEIMQKIFAQEVSVNVHFIPLPLLTAYKKQGYNINNYPVTYDNYSREISLPVYYDLTNEQVQQVIDAVFKAVIES